MEHADLVDFLYTKAGFDISAVNAFGTTLLHRAVECANVKVCTWLLMQHPALIDIRDMEGATAFFYFAHTLTTLIGQICYNTDRKIDLMLYCLCDLGQASLEINEDHNRSPLFYIGRTHRLRTIEYVIQFVLNKYNGVNSTAPVFNWLTPLLNGAVQYTNERHATANRKVDPEWMSVVTHILETAPDHQFALNVKENLIVGSLYTSLNFACQVGSAPLVGLLLSYPKLAWTIDPCHFTSALDTTLRGEFLQAAAYLVGCGAVLSTEMKNGYLSGENQRGIAYTWVSYMTYITHLTRTHHLRSSVVNYHANKRQVVKDSLDKAGFPAAVEQLVYAYITESDIKTTLLFLL